MLVIADYIIWTQPLTFHTRICGPGPRMYPWGLRHTGNHTWQHQSRSRGHWYTYIQHWHGLNHASDWYYIELIDIPVGIATEASKRIILCEAVLNTISNMHEGEVLSLRTVVDSLSIRKTSEIVIRNFKRAI